MAQYIRPMVFIPSKGTQTDKSQHFNLLLTMWPRFEFHQMGILHTLSVRKFTIKILFICNSTLVIYLMNCPCSLGYVEETIQYNILDCISLHKPTIRKPSYHYQHILFKPNILSHLSLNMSPLSEEEVIRFKS